VKFYEEAEGPRVGLVATEAQHTKPRPGDRGRISWIDDQGTVFVNWDSGCTLGLIPGQDRWRVLADD
jgi:hypothetical protein